ncbi:MAG: Crp/Fnr family transcriptional regulator [Pirellulaceae bacterium]|nr:Crp/Fnr family transcriptional regulator [Pirellulaceae bacterium]
MWLSAENQRPKNCLLANLPAAEWQRLRPELNLVPLAARQVIQEPHRPVVEAYFVEQGLISAVNVLDDGSQIEVATVGNEGMTGLAIVTGSETVEQRYFVQIEGLAYLATAPVLLAAATEGTALRRLLHRYSAAFLGQVMQSVACNGLHSVQQRCCRWLLRCLDRSSATEIPVTHESLAQMLGVRRASVTDVLRPLQAEGLIQHRRGVVSVLDRPRLERAACECQQAISRQFDRLICEPRQAT